MQTVQALEPVLESVFLGLQLGLLQPAGSRVCHARAKQDEFGPSTLDRTLRFANESDIGGYFCVQS